MASRTCAALASASVASRTCSALVNCLAQRDADVAAVDDGVEEEVQAARDGKASARRPALLRATMRLRVVWRWEGKEKAAVRPRAVWQWEGKGKAAVRPRAVW